MNQLPEDMPTWVRALIDQGLADSTAVRTAMQEMDGDAERLVDQLVARGHVSARDVALTRAASDSMAFLELNDFRVNLENSELIPEEIARRHVVFPVFHLERTITLAVCRPLDLSVFDQIRLRSGCELEQCYAVPDDIQRLIDWAYGDFAWGSAVASPDWDDILKDVADSPAVKLVDVLLEQAAATRASGNRPLRSRAKQTSSAKSISVQRRPLGLPLPAAMSKKRASSRSRCWRNSRRALSICRF